MTAIRTSAGSVFSRRVRKRVHEKARRSAIAFASSTSAASAATSTRASEASARARSSSRRAISVLQLRDRVARAPRIVEVAEHGPDGHEGDAEDEHREDPRRQVRGARVDERAAGEVEAAAPRQRSPARAPRPMRIAGSEADAAGATLAPGTRAESASGAGAPNPCVLRNAASASTTAAPAGPAAHGRREIVAAVARAQVRRREADLVEGLLRVAEDGAGAREAQRAVHEEDAPSPCRRPPTRGTSRRRARASRARRRRTRRSRARRSGFRPSRTALPTRPPPTRARRGRGRGSRVAPGPAGCHERRSGGAGSPNARPNFHAIISSVSRWLRSASSTSTASSFDERVGHDERRGLDLHGDLREEALRARPPRPGPATGTSPGPGVKASSGQRPAGRRAGPARRRARPSSPAPAGPRRRAGPGRARRRAAGAASARTTSRRGSCHSTNVTLLISRSVVSPARTFLIALSRRNVIPSSWAAFLISAAGRLSRMRPRIWSERSRSSVIAIRPKKPVPLHSMQPRPS